MNAEELRDEFNETYNELLDIISSFKNENFNQKPAADKWSAGQVARHLIKANSGFSQTINGPSEETDRQPDEWIGRIKSDLLNFEPKLTSPDFIVPEDEHFEKDELLNSLAKIETDISETTQNADLTKTLTAFAFPVYGHLTGLETLAFAIYHTQRHVYQLKKIKQAV